jgi:hypothetical protein
MTPLPFIVKGTRVRARWFQPKPLGSFSLAGCQLKTTGSFVEIVGTCRHFRGDDPVSPTKVRVYVEPEGDVAEYVARRRPHGCTCDGHEALVEMNPDHIVEVLP